MSSCISHFIEARKPLICAAVTALAVIVVIPVASADFVLTGTDHLDVATNQNSGILYDTSEADLHKGGYLAVAYVNNNATLWLSSSSTSLSLNAAYAYNDSTVRISNGCAYNVWGYDTAVIREDGDFAEIEGTVDLTGSSSFTQLLGTCANIYADEYATIKISNRSVCQSIDSYDCAQVFVSGGSVGRLTTLGTATATITGGQVDNLYVANNGSMNVGAGVIGTITASGHGIITLEGYDFRTTGGLSLQGNKLIGSGVLTGRWFGADNSSWSINVSDHPSTSSIIVTPEPATLSILAAGALTIVRSRRRR